MIWAVEYSQEQGSFHVDTFDRVLAMNRDTVLKGRTPGYIMLDVFDSYEAAHRFTEKFGAELASARPNTAGGGLVKLI